MIEEIGYGAVSHLIAAKVGALIAAVVSYMVAKYHLNEAEKRARTWREGHNKLLAIDVKENAEIDELKKQLEVMQRHLEVMQKQLDGRTAKLNKAREERDKLKERFAKRGSQFQSERAKLENQLAELRSEREPTTHNRHGSTWAEVKGEASSLPLGDWVLWGGNRYMVVAAVKTLRRMVGGQ